MGKISREFYLGDFFSFAKNGKFFIGISKGIFHKKKLFV